MPITDPLVLRPDVLIIPVPRLPARVRQRIAAGPSDFAVTLRQGRAGSRIVNAATAGLLERFRTPRRVVDVVLQEGVERGVPPDRLLAEVFPVVRDCFNDRFLVAAGTPEAERLEPQLVPGARISGYEIVRVVRVLDDSELYQGRGPSGGTVAIKLARSGDRELRDAFQREAAVLRRLKGTGAPALIAVITWKRRVGLVQSWRAGVSPTVALGSGTLPGEDRMRLALAILRRYARLHRHGILHGDVHPENILVDRRGRITLLDFGQARATRGRLPGPVASRGGVAWYLDPEYAGAQSRGEPDPPLTAAAEQYSLATLVYHLLTSDHYLDFGLERATLLRQITTQPPLPFAARGGAPWPGPEAVLGRALAKTPEDRFPSVAAFAAALGRSAPGARPGGARAMSRGSASRRDAVDETIGLLAAAGERFTRPLEPPTSSVTYGMSGIAFALYRIAGQRHDPALLALADSWLTRAERESGQPGAWYRDDIDMGSGDVGPISFYNTAAGMHAVRAHLAQAVGDSAELTRAVLRFVDASRAPCERLDLFLGRSGTVLGSALLLALLPPDHEDAARALRRLAEETSTFIDHRITTAAESAGDLVSPGMAHGWAGVIYARLCWSRLAGIPLPGWIAPKLEQLASMAQPTGRGVAWPAFPAHGSAAAAGWCSGSAGMVHLWAEAHRTLGTTGYLRLAEASGWNTWEAVEPMSNLCCGIAGRGYALLRLYRDTGSSEWLRRARDLTTRAVGQLRDSVRDGDAMSLYKHWLGIALLAADLDEPEASAMPLFEIEPWPSVRSDG